MEGVFPLTDIYATQVSKLFADCLLVKTWGLPLLSSMVGNEAEKQVECNPPFLFMKTLALLLDSQGSG